MVNNAVAANLLMGVLLLGGLFAANHVKQEVFPDFELDLVSVSVPYPGASPEEVEQGIILAVEEAIRGIDGILETTSTANEGRGSVTAELIVGENRQRIYQDIQQAVSRITTFPAEAEEANVTLVSRRRRVVTVVLHGQQTEAVLREAAERVRDQFLQEAAITQVSIEGVRNLEIAISVPRHALDQYGLTLDDIAAKVRSTAIELPGGGIKTEGGEILLRVMERRDTGLQFADIPIVAGSGGQSVRLGEIADIRDGFEETDAYATFNGEPAVLLEVYRVGDQTPIQVAKATRRQVEAINAELPDGLRLSILTDMSTIYRQRAHLLLKNGAIGLCLVLLLLGCFLEIRLAFWVMMGIPISFLGGFLLLPGLDVSINMISMFAFLIALGIVVDDAIVVGESVYGLHERGVPFLEAAVRGAREMAMPVTFSVLTNIVAFLPLLVIPGTMGKIWRVVPLVVCTVFAVSLLECLFILPAHLGHAKDRKRTRFGTRLHQLQQRFSRWFVQMVERFYGPVLNLVLRWRYLTVAVAAGMLILTIGFLRGGRIPIIPMPRVDADFSVVTAMLPYGSAVENSQRVRDRLEQAAWQVIAANGGERLATGIFAQIGGSFRNSSGGHVVEVRVQLTDPNIRPLNTRDFTNLWREQTGPIAGVEAILFESDRGGPGSGTSINVELAHADSQVLARASAELAEALAIFPVVRDIDTGFSPGKPQLDFAMLPEGDTLGLNSASVARQVRHAFYGAEALRQQRGRNEVKVRVRLPKEERLSEFDLEILRLRTPQGVEVPLAEVARVDRGRAYTSITRRDGRRTVTVSANVNPQTETGRILAAIRGPEAPKPGLLAPLQARLRRSPAAEPAPVPVDELPVLAQLQHRYPGLFYSFQGRERDMVEGLQTLKSGFLLALIGIYALLAVPFRSYIQPLIVMISIPFGIIGAIIGHLIMGYSLSMISMMGIVALAGVVVNDSLVLIDCANQRRRDGLPSREAIHGAGVRRFRPIMLTTLTTFGGLAPMIFEQSRQARFMIPMAISLGYGILFATAITLALVPSLYMIIEDARHAATRLHNWLPGGES